MRYAMKWKRWLRTAEIGLGVHALILIALPFLINVNKFRPKVLTA